MTDMVEKIADGISPLLILSDSCYSCEFHDSKVKTTVFFCKEIDSHSSIHLVCKKYRIDHKIANYIIGGLKAGMKQEIARKSRKNY